MNRTKRCFIIAFVSAAVFALFTFAVGIADVQAIGPENSVVGFATLNRKFFELTGVNMIWYEITDYLGIAAVCIAFAFAVAGAIQLFKRKSLLKVDYRILALGALYVIVIAVYFLFEYVTVNYRPILMNGKLESSYPSSHTMIVVTISTTGVIALKEMCRKRNLFTIISTVFAVTLSTVTVIGRLISGVHWLSDIVGGLLVSMTLIFLYLALISLVSDKTKMPT